jgi:predicted nucleotidyltransferase component of viral defense system
MIKKESLDIGWINKVSSANRKADKILVEKVIRAFLLLEGLAKQKLNFVFKGGTALMLLLDSSKRLSIDIDIILSETPDSLEEILKQASIEQGFTRVELQHRITESKIQKAHYKFFYKPLHQTRAKEESILLDIHFEKVVYQNIIELPISSKFIVFEGDPLTVKVPSIEDILGDKLTAFAPNTTGIPYFKREDSMSMEIIKQLYDIGNLVDVVENIEIVRSTFDKFAKTELEYRNHEKLTSSDVLQDIYQTSLCIVSRGIEGNGDFKQLQAGIVRVSRFIFSEPFHLDKAITFATKAAYAAMLIKHDVKAFEKYDNPLQMKDWTVGKPLWPRINRLKKSSPEAFFYWYKIYELITQTN